MDTDLIMIDLILINYKSTDYLQTCLTSIYERLNGFYANVHVVDNFSGDQVHLVKSIYPKIFLTIHNNNLGFSKAVNKIIKKTSSPYIVLLNPDTIVFDNFFELIISFAQKHPDVGILGPKILNSDGSLQGSARAFPSFLSAWFGRRSLLTKMFPNSRFTSDSILNYKSDGKSPMEVDWISGACMVVKRQALEDVGLLDERFFLYWEDVDWCKRMWQEGWKVIYLPEATIQHKVGGSSDRNLVRSVFEFHKGAYQYFKKYHKSYRLILKPLIFFGLFVRFFGVLFLQFMRQMPAKSKPKSDAAKNIIY
ncbi:MAG: glycosyltransferase family 2 protein [Flavobacteriaceae bacterium]